MKPAGASLSGFCSELGWARLGGVRRRELRVAGLQWLEKERVVCDDEAQEIYWRTHWPKTNDVLGPQALLSSVGQGGAGTPAGWVRVRAGQCDGAWTEHLPGRGRVERQRLFAYFS